MLGIPNTTISSSNLQSGSKLCGYSIMVIMKACQALDTSSILVTRSRLRQWRHGRMAYAADCKSAYPCSIQGAASKLDLSVCGV